MGLRDVMPGLVNGISYASLLFLVAAGLSIIFGVMHFVNLAHGSFYMIGAYVGITVSRHTDSFFLAVVAGGLVTAILGLLMERGLLHRFQGRLLEQVLLTVGLAYLFEDLSRWIWGAEPQSLPVPPLVAGSVTLWGVTIPAYRLCLIAVGAVIALVSWALLDRTRLGAYVRAGVDDLDTLASLGVNPSLVFAVVFAAGAFLSGLGGVLGAPVTGVAPGTDFEMLILALVVVVVGGLGSVSGVIAGSLILGLVDNLIRTMWPEASMFVVYGIMACILVVRPEGLLGRRIR